MSAELTHHGIKGQKWGVRNGPPYPLVSGGDIKAATRRVKTAAKTKEKVDAIVESLSADEKDKLGLGMNEGYLSIDEGEHVIKRVLKNVGDIPVSFFDMLDDEDTIQLAFATRSGEEYRGKGYGSSAAKQAIEWLDKHPNVQRGRDVVWGVREDNAASIAVAKKLGFEFEPGSKHDGWVNYVRKSKDELKHYGIPGQKWGVRNADWYPIADFNKSKSRDIYKKAKNVEPKLTEDVSQAVSKTSAKMYGLDHRLKTKDSIERKLSLGKSIKDAVRYTAVSNENDFVKNYVSIKNNLETKGYKETKCKNYFMDYRLGKVKHKSVQCNFEDPDGYTFEIQFQTPSSQSVKDKKVPLYEEARNPKTSDSRKAALERQMELLAETIKDPKDIDKILSHSAGEKEVVCMDSEYSTYDLLYGEEDSLAHHGIPGQKWGVRNADWYPIADFLKSKGKSAASNIKKGADYAVRKTKSAASRVSNSVRASSIRKKRLKALDKARQTKIQNVKAREQAEANAAEQERVLAKGSIQELLKYTNKVDNRTLAKAIEDRQYLDRKIAEVTPRQLTKTEKLMQTTKNASEVALNVANTASNFKNAWDKARPVLENLGLIEKKKSDDVFTRSDSEAITREILSRISSGKIKKDEIESYQKALDALRKIEGKNDNNSKKGKGDNNGGGKQKDEVDKAFQKLKLEEARYDFEKRKKTDREAERKEKEAKEASNSNSDQSIADRIAYAKKLNNSSKEKLSEKPSFNPPASQKTNIDKVINANLSDYDFNAESWWEDLYD